MEVHQVCAMLVVSTLATGAPMSRAVAQSPFSSGDAKGSVLLKEGSFIQLEAADKAVKASYQREDLASLRRRAVANPAGAIRGVTRYGASIRAAVNNNRGSIFSKDEVSVGGEIGVNYGWSNLLSYRRSNDASFGAVPLNNILDDALNNAGKTRPSLKVLHDAIVHTSTLLGDAGAAAPPPAADVELVAVRGALIASRAKAAAAEAALNAVQNDALEATRARLRFEYETALRAIAVAVDDEIRLVKSREEAVKKAYEAFHIARTDYESIEPSFAPEIERAFPGVRAQLAARFPGTFPPIGPVPPVVWAQPLTPEEVVVLKYLLLGLPPAGDARARQARDELALAKQRLLATGPGQVYWDQLDFRLGLARTQHALLVPDAVFASQVKTEKPTAISGLVSYNVALARSAARFSCTCIFGVAIGGEQRNNTSALKSIDLRDVVFASTSDTTVKPVTVRTGETTQKVLRGTYAEYDAFLSSTDAVFYPSAFNNQIAINGYTRFASGGAGVEGGITPGVAIMLLKEGAPQKVLGGVSVHWENAKKAKVDLVVGFNF